MENKTVITVENVPAKIIVNFDEVREAVEAHLEKFKGIVITPDSITEGKTLIKEINTTRKELDARRKLEIGNASAPIKEFDEKMKQLIALHDEAKGQLTIQIAKFEAEVKAKVETALNEELHSQWNSQGVKDGFRAASVMGLVLLGSFTAKSRLTAKAKSEISMRVAADLSRQQKTELRLAKLEAESYKAGLAAPLTQGHVEQFLFDADESYDAKLAALFASEVEREAMAVEAHEKRIEARNLADIKAQPEPEPVQQLTAEPVQTVTQKNYEPAKNGEVMMQVVCILNIPVSNQVPEIAVENKVHEKMLEAGFTTIESIKATKQQEA